MIKVIFKIFQSYRGRNLIDMEVTAINREKYRPEIRLYQETNEKGDYGKLHKGYYHQLHCTSKTSKKHYNSRIIQHVFLNEFLIKLFILQEQLLFNETHFNVNTL